MPFQPSIRPLLSRGLAASALLLVQLAPVKMAHAVVVGGGGSGGSSGATAENNWPVPGDGALPSSMQWISSRADVQAFHHLTTMSEKGSSSYNYSFTLPPAILKPDLGISYSSEGGLDTMLPWGWSLRGVMSITRPTARAYIFDERSLGGTSAAGTLKVKSRPTGQVVYWLASASQAHVQAVYTTASDSWTVTSKDGLTCSLTAASGSPTATWRATTCSDASGNSYDISYDASHRVSTIEYGGTTAGAFHRVQVAFTYASSTHAHSSFKSGAEEDYQGGLSRVAIKVRTSAAAPWSKIREYELSLLDKGGLTLLDKIREVGYDGATSLAEPYTSFGYSSYSSVKSGTNTGPGAIGQQTTISSYSGSPINKTVWTLVTNRLIDFNGDGLPDLVSGGSSSSGTSTWGVSYQEVDSSGNHSFGGTTRSFPGPAFGVSEMTNDWLARKVYTSSQAVDMNGDGFMDVVVSPDSTTWQIWYGTGAGFDGPYNEPAPWKYSQISNAPEASAPQSSDLLKGMLDVDGDGWMDCINPSSGVVYHRWPFKGLGWNTTSSSLGIAADYREVSYIIEPDPIVSARDWISTTRERAGFHDLNGDGLPDYVRAYGTTWWVRFGTPDGISATEVAWPSPSAYTSIVEEGYPDVWVSQPCGAGDCGYRYEGRDSRQTQGLIDVDGDGFTDLYMGEQGGWYQNLGDGFATTPRTLPSWWPDALETSHPTATSEYFAASNTHVGISNSDTVSSVSDVDHDSIPDALTIGSSSTLETGTYSKPHLLLTVDNGRGASTTMAYEPSTDCDPAGKAYETQEMSSLHHVLASVSTSDSTQASGTATTTYVHHNGKEVDGVFQGFGSRMIDQHVTGGDFYTKDPSSTQIVSYDLGRDQEPAVLTRQVYTDGNRNFSPALARGGPTSKNRISETYTYNTLYWKRLPVALTRTESSESGAITKQYHMTWGYDSYGNLLTLTHDGGPDAHDAISVTHTYVASADATLWRMASKTTTGYDPLTATTRDFEKTTWLYDGHSLATDALTEGELTGIRVASGWTGGGEALGATSVGWDLGRGPRGQLNSVTDIITGSVDSATYGFGGAVMISRTDALGHTSLMTADSRGRISDVTDPNGAKTTYVFDALDRVIEEDRQGRTGPSYKVLDKQYTTSSVPNFVRTRKYTSAGVVESTAYDVKDGDGHSLADWKQSATGAFLVTDSLHDHAGNLIGQSRPITVSSFFTPITRPGGTLAAATAGLLTYHDAFGNTRETHKDYAGGIGPSTVSLDVPWESVENDEAGYSTRLTYDAHGRIKLVAQGSSQDSLSTTGTYAYDPLHRLVKYTDGRAQVYTYSYDGAGRLRRSVGPDVGWQESTYQSTHKVSQTNAAGGVAEWEYDALGRPTQLTVTDPVSATGEAVYNWTYDTTWVGKVATTTDPAGQTSTTYDDFGRPSQVSRSYPTLASPMVLAQTFDLQGRPATSTFPFGASVSSTFTKGWLTSVLTSTATASTQTINYTYNAFGLPSGWTNGTLTAATSNTTPLWPASLSLTKGATTLDLRTYTWLENGLVASRKVGSATAKTFAYDALQRVSTVKQGLSTLESYGYDAAGNLTGLTDATGTFTYSAAGTLGAVGNQVPKRVSGATTQLYHYDASGRLSDSQVGAAVRTYQYDGLGRLRAVLDSGAYVEVIDRDADGAVIRSENGSPVSGPTPRFVYTFGGSRLDSLTAEKTDQITRELSVVSNQRRWMFVEYDGQVASLRDDAGVAIGTRELSVYGATTSSSGTPWALAAFHGLAEEPFVPFFSAGPRHLSKEAGQWLEPEPLLLLGIPKDRLRHPTHLAAYRYGADSPLAQSDRNGYGTKATLMADTVISDTVSAVLGTEPAYDPTVGQEIADEALSSAGDGAQHVCTRYVKNAIANSIGAGKQNIKGGDGKRTPTDLANALSADGRFLEVGVPQSALASNDAFDNWASQYQGAVVTMNHGNTYHSTVVASDTSGHTAASDFKQSHVVPYSTGATNIRVFVPITPRGDQGEITFQAPAAAP